VDYRQISSKMALDQDRFDFTAKMPPDTTREQFRLMLQSLLAERFHFKSHMDSRQFPGYELTVSKTGLKVKESSAAAAPAVTSPDDGFPAMPPGRPGMASTHTSLNGYYFTRLRAQQQTMSSLAGFVHPPEDGPVVDKTGLTAKYDFTLEFTQEFPGAPPETRNNPPAIPDIFTALQQQLGLRLTEKKVMLDVVVVDSVDRKPIEN
jgi:uncharacterized protein (TIGR03435 family)